MKFKTSFLSIIGFAFMTFSFLQVPSALAVNEICAAGTNNCCTAVPVVEDVGGCPSGTSWIGGASDGQCEALNPACPGKTFSCATNQCITIPVGPACPSNQINLGGGVCAPRLYLFQDTVVDTIYKIWGGDILGRLVYVPDSDCVDGQVVSWTASGWVCADVAAASSLWTQSATDIYYDTGKVGIGTATPSQMLHVEGDAKFVGGVIMGEGSSGVSSGSENLQINSKSSIWRLGVLNTVSASDGDLFIAKSPSTGGDGTFTITYDTGNVGIGTSTPNGKLHVQNTMNIASGTNFADRVAPLIVGDGDGTGAALLFDGNQIEGAKETNPLYLNYNSTSRLSLNKGGGPVVIGDSSPATASGHVVDFDVKKDVKLFRSADNEAHTWLPYIDGEIYLTGNRDGGPISVGTGDIHLRSWGTVGGYNADKMIIKGDATGYVGIGTGTPTHKLDVRGDIEVRGDTPMLQLDVEGGGDLTDGKIRFNDFEATTANNQWFEIAFNADDMDLHFRADDNAGADILKLTNGGSIFANGRIFNDTASSANYDAWIQGGTASSGIGRNLILLGRNANTDTNLDDVAYLNYNSEYTDGTIIGGPVGIGSSGLVTANGIEFHVVGDGYFSGKLGIGENAPVYELDVAGDAYLTGQTGIGMVPVDDYKLTLYNSVADDVLVLLGPDSYTAGARIRFGDNNAAGDFVYIEEDADDFLKIHADYGITLDSVYEGTVSIGKSNNSMIHLESAWDAVIKLEADTDNSGEGDQPRIEFSQDGGLVTGHVGYADSSNHMRVTNDYDNADADIDFLTRGQVRMTIEGDGSDVKFPDKAVQANEMDFYYVNDVVIVANGPSKGWAGAECNSGDYLISGSCASVHNDGSGGAGTGPENFNRQSYGANRSMKVLTSRNGGRRWYPSGITTGTAAYWGMRWECEFENTEAANTNLGLAEALCLDI